MPSKRPHVARLGEGRLQKLGFDVKIIVVETVLQVFLEQVVDLVWIKTGQRNIKGLCLQRLDLDA